MKKILALSALLLVVSAPAFAQLNIAWNGCPGTGATNVADVCAAPATMLGTIELAAPVPNFTALDYVMDFQTTAAILPAFWQRSAGECAAGSITFLTFHIAGLDVGCGPELTDVTGPFGSGISVASASWGSGPAIAAIPDNRGKLVGSMVRNAPGLVQAGVQATGKWTFSNTPNPACAGCNTPAAMVWNSAVLFSNAAAGSASPEAEPVVLNGPGQHQNCVTVAGGDGGGLCGATPTQNKTWGQIKSLYR